MRTKKCRDCGMEIVHKSKDAVYTNGYMISQCAKCRKRVANEYAEKKRKLMKEYRSYWNED